MDDSFVKETKQQLLCVSVLPPLKDEDVNTNWLLLGIVDPSIKSLASAGERPFYVNIFLAKNKQNDNGYSCRDLVKIGIGLLHSSYQSALNDSPIDD